METMYLLLEHQVMKVQSLHILLLECWAAWPEILNRCLKFECWISSFSLHNLRCLYSSLCSIFFFAVDAAVSQFFSFLWKPHQFLLVLSVKTVNHTEATMTQDTKQARFDLFTYYLLHVRVALRWWAQQIWSKSGTRVAKRWKQKCKMVWVF